MRRCLFLVHRWLGLILGVFLALQGLLGAYLVVADPLDRWLHPEVVRAEAPGRDGAERIGPVEAYRAVAAAHPDRHIWQLWMPQEPDGVYRAILDGDDGERIYIDPYSGRVLGSRDAFETLETPVRVLHTGEIGGPWLETGVGLLAVALLVLAVSGLVVWWPGRTRLRRALAFSTRNLATLARDSHRWAGLLLLPFIGLIAVGGIYLIFHHSAQALVNTMWDQEPFPPALELGKSAGPADAAPVGDLVASARGALPEARIALLTFPDKAGSPVAVRMRYPNEWHPIGNSTVLLHPDSGEFLAVYDLRSADPGSYALDHLYPLHIGTYGGTPTRTLHFLAGLATFLFAVTGTYLWWRRRPRNRRP